MRLASSKDRIDSAAALFREISLDGASSSEIYHALKNHGRLRLKYMGEKGHDPGYIFRGELDYDDPLQTRIERKVRSQRKEPALDCTSITNEERRAVEEEVERQDSLIQQMKPAEISREDVFWWLSAMQHYEGSTRLLDFTRDIEVALFFALEQHQHTKEKQRDLMIYCFPCKDVEDGGAVTLGNKSPIARSDAGIDINRALGCLIGLSWMDKHHRIEARSRQGFGWDRAYYPIDRLTRQKGMFVYPYDYPKSLPLHGPSWLIQNLCIYSNDRFNMGCWGLAVPPLRIRIKRKWAEKLTDLNARAGFTHRSIYGTQ